MTWDGGVARPALAAVLSSAFEATNVAVFASPPATFNPPALVVQFPQTVAKFVPSFGIDLATWTVLGAVSLDLADALDALMNQTAAAIFLDPTLGGAVQVTKMTELRNWRILVVGGSEMLTAELALESRM